MKPEINSNIKVFFKNGLQVEGKVHSWGKEIILTTDNDHSFIVITKPKEIIMYNLVTNLPTAAEDISTINYRGVDEPHKSIEESIIQDEIIIKDEPMSPEYMRLLSLAELHKLKMQEEKKAIANKLKTHHTGEVRKVTYTGHDQIPGFYQKQSTK